MNRSRINILYPVVLVCGAIGNFVNAADVAQWSPHDFSFYTTAATNNPFMVPFFATVKGPDGNEFTLPGFYDGDGTWKIRVSPNVEGAWSLVTRSELKALDGQRAKFTCVKNRNPHTHGVLQVDKAHPHHFVFQDGTRFFMQGYEYDWLWALDMDKAGVPTVETSLDILTQHGFNYVILNSYAHDTSWRKARRRMMTTDRRCFTPGRATMTRPTIAG